MELIKIILQIIGGVIVFWIICDRLDNFLTNKNP